MLKVQKRHDRGPETTEIPFGHKLWNEDREQPMVPRFPGASVLYKSVDVQFSLGRTVHIDPISGEKAEVSTLDLRPKAVMSFLLEPKYQAYRITRGGYLDGFSYTLVFSILVTDFEKLRKKYEGKRSLPKAALDYFCYHTPYDRRGFSTSALEYCRVCLRFFRHERPNHTAISLCRPCFDKATKLVTEAAADAREDQVQKEFTGQLSELDNKYNPGQHLENIEGEEEGRVDPPTRKRKKREEEGPVENPDITMQETDNGYLVTTYSDAVIIGVKRGRRRRGK